MYRFKVTCPSCSSQNVLPARRMLVRVEDSSLAGGECVFTCLVCRRTGSVGVESDGVAKMLVAGVAWVCMREPRVEHPETAAAGPPLTRDDLLDLHAVLEQDGWFEDLSATLATEGAELA
jgi:hypothetical protein